MYLPGIATAPGGNFLWVGMLGIDALFPPSLKCGLSSNAPILFARDLSNVAVVVLLLLLLSSSSDLFPESFPRDSESETRLGT